MTEKSDSAFRTISEAAEEVGMPAHVLRFWETRFAQLQPLKRAGGRRYYRPADMALLRQIRSLLQDSGMTIRGAQLALQSKANGAAPPARPALQPDAPGQPRPAAGNELLVHRQQLLSIRDRLAAALAA